MRKKQVLVFLIISIFFFFLSKAFHANTKDAFEKPAPLVYHPGLPADTLVQIAAGPHYKKSFIHNLFFGKHYRDIWALPVEAPVFDIGKVAGGLEIIKRGGNQQTVNLRLKDREGKEYVLRSVDKDQAKALPGRLRNTFVKVFLRDQASALNPYGALIIPTLAEAIGILHTHPKLFYVPYDSRFKQYADDLAGRLAIFEEFPDDEWHDTHIFDGAEKIVSIESLLEKRFESFNATINSREYARCRLFDVLISDWDRHSGQWRWIKKEIDSVTVYRPVPRDRDAAFYKYSDGFLTSFSLLFIPKLQTFSKNYRNIKGLIKNAEYLDNLVLPALSRNDWLVIADSIKNNLTDKVIDEAVCNFPPEVYNKIGRETAEILRERRNKLSYAAGRMYDVLAKQVMLVGSDGGEHVEIARLNDTETRVSIRSKHSPYHHFEKTFNADDTRKIEVYALDGNDEIAITGNVNRGIKLLIYGGKGRDKITDNSVVKGLSKKTAIYDSPDGNDIFFGTEARDKTTADTTVFYFNRSGRRREKNP